MSIFTDMLRVQNTDICICIFTDMLHVQNTDISHVQCKVTLAGSSSLIEDSGEL